MFCNQLIDYLLTGYPVRTENTKPSVTSHGTHFLRSVLCDFRLSIFQYGPGNQLIKDINKQSPRLWFSHSILKSCVGFSIDNSTAILDRLKQTIFLKIYPYLSENFSLSATQCS